MTGHEAAGIAAGLADFCRDRDTATRQFLARVASSATCRRGCSACCSNWVNVTFADALLLAGHLLAVTPRGDVPGLMARLEREARKYPGHDRPSWFALDRPCIFLAPDGACSVYAARPMACRECVVTTPAAWCAPENLLKVINGKQENVPGLLPCDELHAISGRAQECVRPMLRKFGIEVDLPPAPLPSAVLAAMHFMLTGSTDVLRAWAASTPRTTPALRDRQDADAPPSPSLPTN